MDLFLRKIKIRNQIFYLIFKWEYCDVNLKIIDKDFNLFYGEIKRNDFENFSSKLDRGLDEFWDESLALYKSKEEERNDVDIRYNDQKVTFVWKKVLADCLIKQQLGSIELVQDITQDKVSVMTMVCEIACQQEDFISELDAQKTSLEHGSQQAEKHLKGLLNMKEELEKDLFSKFTLVLNTKKGKIRELLDEISLLEGFKRKGESNNNDADGDKTKGDEEDKDDDGGDDDDSPLVKMPRRSTKERPRRENNKKNKNNKNNNANNKNNENNNNANNKIKNKNNDNANNKIKNKNNDNANNKNNDKNNDKIVTMKNKTKPSLSDLETESEDEEVSKADKILQEVKERRMNEGVKNRRMNEGVKNRRMNEGSNEGRMNEGKEDDEEDNTIELSQSHVTRQLRSSQSSQGKIPGRSGRGTSGRSRRGRAATADKQQATSTTEKGTGRSTRASKSSKTTTKTSKSTTKTAKSTTPTTTSTNTTTSPRSKSTKKSPNKVKERMEKWVAIETEDLFFEDDDDGMAGNEEGPTKTTLPGQKSPSATPSPTPISSTPLTKRDDDNDSLGMSQFLEELL